MSGGINDLITQVQPPSDDDNSGINLADHSFNRGDQQSTVEDDKKEQQKSCCFRFWCCAASKKKNTDRKPDGGNGGNSKQSGSGSGTPPPRQAPPSAPSPSPPSSAPGPPLPHPTTPPPPAATFMHPSVNGGPGKKYLLPPLASEHKGKKCLVLDLDETLVHSSFKPIPNADFVISIELENVIHRVYVRKRPGVDNFLRHISDKFEVVVFTASLSKYADPLLDILDRNRIVHTRLFREACVQHYGNYVKDLSHLGRPLEHIIIIDNSPFSYMFQPDNAIPITSWFNDKNDRQLYDLLPFLDSIMPADDVCQILQRKRLSFMNAPHQQS